MAAKLRQVLVFPDTHRPYHDARAYDLALRVGDDLQGGKGPDEILVLGDYGDFYSVSSHGKDSALERHLSREVDNVSAALRSLEQRWPHAKRTFIEGNHEDRLRRYLNDKAPELYGLVSTEALLGLEPPRWTFVPYGPKQLVRVGDSHLYARHEPLTGGVLPAHGTVLRAGCSVIYGHDHRSQQAQVTMANGDTHLGVSVGWLGNEDRPEFSYTKGHPNWALGFGVVTYDPSTGLFFVDAVRIIARGRGGSLSYTCYHGGTWYEG